MGRWTSNENSEKITSVISSSKSVNCVKEAVFLLHVFFISFKILKKSVERWTSNENSEKNSFSLTYILIYKCGTCGQKVPFYFMFSFCYVPFTILTQKVWTRGQVMKILFISLFLLPYTFQNFDKTCG